MRMFQKKDEGFTLVELMVVVLIIGILVAIAIPVFNAARDNAQQRACFANQRTMDGALEQWRAEDVGATDPTDWATLVTAVVGGGYIRVEPVCPAAGAYVYTPAGGTTCDAVTGGFAGHGKY